MSKQDESRNGGGHHGHNYRESFAVACGEVFLEAHVHDQAATVSVAVCPDEGVKVAFGDIVSALSAVASAVEDAGGIVGHLKAFGSQDGSFANASVTVGDREPDVGGDAAVSFGCDADIQFVAIALFISQDELIAICKGAIADAIMNKG